MPLKVYHVQGTRHCAVIFATSAEEAVAQAVERGLVSDWEMPDAVEVPLPPGYYLAYDPLLAAEQPALPLSLDEPEPERPHTVTRSGVKVYDDWRDNIVADADAPPPGLEGRVGRLRDAHIRPWPSLPGQREQRGCPLMEPVPHAGAYRPPGRGRPRAGA